MDFKTLAKNRWSCRSFSDRKVEKEKLETILEAGVLAPTAKNMQPQRILVADSEEAIEKLKKCTPCHYNCKTALIVCYDKSDMFIRPFDSKPSGDIDASIVTTHMMLQAYELGVCSTWVMFFKPDEVRAEFNLPKEYEPSAILVLGYPAEDAKPSDNHSACDDRENLIFYNKF